MLAIASLNNVLVSEGLLSVDDIDLGAKGVTGDERVYEDMSPANRDASVFPSGCCSYKQCTVRDECPPVLRTGEMVGQTKQPYNDQM